MTTDDAPRPALDAAAIEEGQRLLSAVTPGDYWVNGADSGYGVTMGYDIVPLPPGTHNMLARRADARAVCWLLQHADALLAAAAERDALAREAAQRARAALEGGE